MLMLMHKESAHVLNDLPYCVCGAKSEGKIINKKPIIATEEEQEENSRSKSAKLRIFEKIIK